MENLKKKVFLNFTSLLVVVIVLFIISKVKEAAEEKFVWNNTHFLLLIYPLNLKKRAPKNERMKSFSKLI